MQISSSYTEFLVIPTFTIEIWSCGSVLLVSKFDIHHHQFCLQRVHCIPFQHESVHQWPSVLHNQTLVVYLVRTSSYDPWTVVTVLSRSVSVSPGPDWFLFSVCSHSGDKRWMKSDISSCYIFPCSVVHMPANSYRFVTSQITACNKNICLAKKITVAWEGIRVYTEKW